MTLINGADANYPNIKGAGEELMEDSLIVTILGWLLRAIFFLVVECLFYQAIYYIGAIPVWIISGRRLPSSDPTELPKKDRRWYALIGVVQIAAILFAWVMLQ